MTRSQTVKATNPSKPIPGAGGVLFDLENLKNVYFMRWFYLKSVYLCM